MPWSRRGARVASMHLVKVHGDKARSKERTQKWYASAPKANLRNILCSGKISMWKYASFRSIVTNQSLDWICGTMSLTVCNLASFCFYVRRVLFKPCRSFQVFFGYYKVPTIKPCISLTLAYTFYGSSRQNRVQILIEKLFFLAHNCCYYGTETRWMWSKLNPVSFLYGIQNPLRDIGQ